MTSASANGILTFEDFRLELDSHLTLIVGPNGAGKSNFGRLFEIVSRVIQTADGETPGLHHMLQRYLNGRRAGLDEQGIEIRLAYQLTEEFEKDLLTSFIRACSVSAVVGNNQGFDTSGIERWADGIQQGDLSELFVGEMVVHHGGTPDAQWECAIEFDVADISYRWELLGIHRDSLVQTNDRMNVSLQGADLSSRLRAGLTPSTSPVTTTPIQPFNVSMMLPDSNTQIQCSFDLGRQPPPRAFRGFAEQIGVDPIGMGAGQRNHYGLAHVLWMILRRASITTSDSRLLPDGSHSWSSESVSVQFGREGRGGEARIPAELLRLKNGRSTELQTFRKIQSLFHTFTHGRTMEMAFVGAGAEIHDVESEEALAVVPVVLVSVNPRRVCRSWSLGGLGVGVRLRLREVVIYCPR
jgi:hypothetical protein